MTISGMFLIGEAVVRLQPSPGGFTVRMTKGRESKAVYQLPDEMKRAQQWIDQHVETEAGRAIATAALSCYDDVRRIRDMGAR
jgi:hypothetical protein